MWQTDSKWISVPGKPFHLCSLMRIDRAERVLVHRPPDFSATSELTLLSDLRQYHFGSVVLPFSEALQWEWVSYVVGGTKGERKSG